LLEIIVLQIVVPDLMTTEDRMDELNGNASASESDADHSDESQGSPNNSKKRKRNLKIS